MILLNISQNPGASSDHAMMRLESTSTQRSLERAPGPELEAGAREAWAAGDHNRVITILMHEYRGAVFAYCRTMIRDKDQVDDLLQTIFIQAHHGLAHFQARSTFKTWIFGIARHRCLDELKSLRRRARRWSPWDPTQSEAQPAGRTPAEDDAPLETERARALDECMQRLSPELRDLVVQRFQRALSYDEIAGLTQQSPGSLRVRLFRALSSLRVCLEKKGFASTADMQGGTCDRLERDCVLAPISSDVGFSVTRPRDGRLSP